MITKPEVIEHLCRAAACDSYELVAAVRKDVLLAALKLIEMPRGPHDVALLRTVAAMRLDGMQYKDIGKALDVTAQRARQLLVQAEERFDFIDPRRIASDSRYRKLGPEQDWHAGTAAEIAALVQEARAKIHASQESNG